MMIRGLEIVEAKARHIVPLCADLRQLHREDLALMGADPEAMIWRCYCESSLRRSVTLNGDVLMMWGCAGSLLGNGEAWLFATNKAQPLRFGLLRLARRELSEMAVRYGSLEGRVRSTEACRFLEHFGAQIKDCAGSPFKAYSLAAT